MGIFTINMHFLHRLHIGIFTIFWNMALSLMEPNPKMGSTPNGAWEKWWRHPLLCNTLRKMMTSPTFFCNTTEKNDDVIHFLQHTTPKMGSTPNGACVYN